MNTAATLRRHLCIIRAIQPPFTYPSKDTLIERLHQEGFSELSDSSFKRDKKELRLEYGIYIEYSKRYSGYYIDFRPDEDIADFKAFVELLERRERLEFVNNTLSGIRDIGHFLQLEKNPQFTGINHLPKLWEALRAQRIISFNYSTYGPAPNPAQFRTVEPGLLFEYKNRFYLDAWDMNKNQIRTFGLDRITDLIMTSQTVKKYRGDIYRPLRRHVIGVNSVSDAAPVGVVLRLTSLQANYLQSLPIHHSQKIKYQTAEYTDFELFVVLNKELEIEILSLGSAVEVLEPIELRNKIGSILLSASQKYQ